MPKCSIIQSGNDYAVKTPKSQKFIDELKANIPASQRSFDWDQKAWLVSPKFVEMASHIVQEYFNEKPEIPELVKIETETKWSFQLDYVGIPKERDGQAGKTALGFSKGQWITFKETHGRNNY